MHSIFRRFLFCTLLLPVGTAFAAVKNGAQGPNFTLQTPSGESVSLSDFAGKYVVLEWTNPNCPFVKKFYDVGAMQRFQAQVQEEGTVWLTINSTKPSHRQYLDTAETLSYISGKDVNSTWLLDEDGTVGKAYGATNTPHMFVLDPLGTVIYQGAIDDKRSANSNDIAEANNFVMAALEAAMAGQPIERDQTRAYGCGIKY